MLTIKNPRVKMCGIVFVAMSLLSGCMPPGPKALLRGKRLIEQRKFGQAVDELKTATTLMVTNAQAWNYLGLAYQYSGKSVDAQHAYERAVLLDHDLSEAHYNLGCLLLELNQTNAARNELTAFTLRRANSVDGLVKLGTAQTRCRDWNGAEKSFHDALRLDAANVEALNGLGIVRLQRGRPAEAVDYFSKALSKAPNFSPALLNLGIVQQQYLKDRTAAIQTYRKYVAQTKDPDGSVGALLRQLEIETSAAQRPVATVPSNQPAQAIAPVQHAVAATSNAVAVTKPVTNTPSKLVAAPKPAANASPVASNPPPTKVDAVRLDPAPTYKVAQDVPPPVSAPTGPVNSQATTSAPPLVAKVTPGTETPAKRTLLQKMNPMNLFRTDSKPVKSSAGSDRALGAEETNAAVIAAPAGVARYTYRSPGAPVPGDRAAAEKYFNLGLQAQQAKRLPDAIQNYRQAIQSDPAYFEANYNLGMVSADMGNLQGALENYEVALAIQAGSLDARYNLALALKQGGYYVDSAVELEKILTKHPDDARVHLAVANLYAQQLHQPASARKHYVRVLEIDPKNSQASAIRYWLTSNP